MTGYKITSIDELQELAWQRKSVLIARWAMMRTPASRVMCMPAWLVNEIIKQGMWRYLPNTHKPPRALLNDSKNPQPGDTIRWSDRESTVLAIVNQTAYVWARGGTAFVDFALITAIESALTRNRVS